MRKSAESSSEDAERSFGGGRPESTRSLLGAHTQIGNANFAPEIPHLYNTAIPKAGQDSGEIIKIYKKVGTNRV